MNSLNRFADPVYCIARLVVGLMFACHGGQKILGFPPGGHGSAEGLMLLGGIIELVCGFLIAFGLLTRVVALFVVGYVAAGFFMVHVKVVFSAQGHKVDVAVVNCWMFIFVLFQVPVRRGITALSAD